MSKNIKWKNKRLKNLSSQRLSSLFSRCVHSAWLSWSRCSSIWTWWKIFQSSMNVKVYSPKSIDLFYSSVKQPSLASILMGKISMVAQLLKARSFHLYYHHRLLIYPYQFFFKYSSIISSSFLYNKTTKIKENTTDYINKNTIN